MYVCYRRNGTCENVWSRRVRVRLNLKMITLLKQINYTLVWTLCDTTRAAQQHPVFDGWCIQHCSTSWIVFDRVAVAAGRMVSAAIIFCTFISLHIQNFHAAGIQLRFFLHSFHLHLLPCMKYWIALHVYRRQMYTICLTHSEHGRPRWIALNCTSMHDWRAHGHQMTNAMFCENKKKKKRKKLLPRETKRQRAHSYEWSQQMIDGLTSICHFSFRRGFIRNSGITTEEQKQQQRQL